MSKYFVGHAKSVLLIVSRVLDKFLVTLKALSEYVVRTNYASRGVNIDEERLSHWIAHIVCAAGNDCRIDPSPAL
jgi:hypothetical protein